jgi:DNA replication protein DnaC
MQLLSSRRRDACGMFLCAEHVRQLERKSVILTTNRPFKEWNEVFPNAACIVTLLDRLLHHADVTVIEGESYRVRESEQETARRRKK